MKLLPHSIISFSLPRRYYYYLFALVTHSSHLLHLSHAILWSIPMSFNFGGHSTFPLFILVSSVGTLFNLKNTYNNLFLFSTFFFCYFLHFSSRFVKTNSTPPNHVETYLDISTSILSNYGCMTYAVLCACKEAG